jgi:hypothetical protein
MRASRSLLLLGLVWTAFADAALAAPPEIAVTACGQQVPRATIGYLTGDLACAGASFGVRLESGARLDLRGFTISGGIVTVGCEPCNASGCLTRKGKCEVYGGTLAGSYGSAIQGNRVVAHDLEITDYVGYAIIAFNRIDVRNAVISNDADSNGIQANHLVTLEGSALSRTPVQARRVKVASTSVTGGSHWGIAGSSLKLGPGSNVTGNGTNDACGVSTPCFDLMARQRPKVDPGATCGISGSPPFPDEPSVSWGVCALD